MELTWVLIKRQASQQVSKTKAQIRANLKTAFHSLKESPEQVRVFFREAGCKYILAGILVTRLLHRSVQARSSRHKLRASEPHLGRSRGMHGRSCTRS